MAQVSSVLLLLAALVAVSYAQSPSGKGTAHCDNCGLKSNNIDLSKDGTLTPADISRCTLETSAADIEDSIFLCECREPHFVGDGLTCDNFDECVNSTDNCDNNAICTDTESSFTCECEEGYEGDGVTCVDFNECGNVTYVEAHNHTHNPCGHSGDCKNTIGSYYCDCIEGLYKQVPGTNDTECTDINECADPALNNCVGNSECVNDEPKFHCECLPGYTEGSASTGQGSDCQNVNECDKLTTPCGEYSYCNDTVGGYNCTCEGGFTLANVLEPKGDCRDINECTEEAYDCSSEPNKVCKNKVGSAECVCGGGFTEQADGTCGNKDECKDDSPCDPNAKCTDSPGSYSCACLIGYIGDGFNCYDINECEAGGDRCDRTLARCINSEGSYSCKCIYGYTGTGREGQCTEIESGLEKKGAKLARAQTIIRVHLLENERQQLENHHEILLRRCDKQDQQKNRIVRPKRAILDVTDEQAANAELWISTLESHIHNLKLQNHVLEISCPE